MTHVLYCNICEVICHVAYVCLQNCLTAEYVNKKITHFAGNKEWHNIHYTRNTQRASVASVYLETPAAGQRHTPAEVGWGLRLDSRSWCCHLGTSATDVKKGRINNQNSGTVRNLKTTSMFALYVPKPEQYISENARISRLQDVHDLHLHKHVTIMSVLLSFWNNM